MNEASARPRGGNGKAIALGILAMFLGAALWAGITIVTEHRFGLLAIGAVTAFGMVYRRLQAARVETAARNVAAAAQPYGQAYGAPPQAGAPVQAHPHAQPYGGAPHPAPFPPQPYGQGQAPYGQQPYGAPQQQPYGGRPGHGQQQSPPR